MFFAIGFETTAPANVMSVLQAQRMNIHNFSILVSHVCVPPAMHAILGSPTKSSTRFSCSRTCLFCNGILGIRTYRKTISNPNRRHWLRTLGYYQGILETIKLLEAGKYEVVNAYSRAVTYEGNKPAQEAIKQVFQVCDRKWRGIG